MSFLDDVLQAINANIDSLEILNNFYYFSCKGELNSPNENLGEQLVNIFRKITVDEVFLVLHLKNGYNSSISFSTENIESFEEQSREFFENFDQDESTSFTLESNDWKYINIFHMPSFLSFIKSNTLIDNLKAWSNYFKNNKCILNIWDKSSSYNNNYFYIKSIYPDYDSPEFKEWDSTPLDISFINNLVENRDKVSHFVNADQISLIPNFFAFSEEFELKKHFNFIRSVLILIFLSDYSNIDNNSLIFKIKGFKTLRCELENNLVDVAESELIELYNWVYSDGPFVDKIGIARNVISIHISNEDICTLEKGTCHSAQSGYDLYLKDNVKQYIEVKNKIGDMLYTQSEKASGIVKDMFTLFKTSMLAFSTYFISAFLYKIFEKKDGALNNWTELFQFNFPTKALGFFLILISIFYLLFARKEVDFEVKRLERKYQEIENRYKDLLNDQDLDKILRQSNVDGKTAREIEIEYILDSKQRYSQYWILVIIILFFILSFFGLNKVINIYIMTLISIGAFVIFLSKT
ncbi:hypothetical protein [Acinetobacter nosocomialis]|uniref:hypothetical protein n=1 Tax=Acinetobacter nosocomialis TaxID=106654 RepID=UPI000DE73C06|nr:hypothetical protein [Acinetobacter nosocomialis]SSR51315.1 Uncharacterised protein [Acinetobacter nosocomialis]